MEEIPKQVDKEQRRFAKAWNATQDIGVALSGNEVPRQSWSLNQLSVNVLIVSEGLERDTGSRHQNSTNLHRTYFDKPDPGNDVHKQERLEGYEKKGYFKWDINEDFKGTDNKYDLIVARSSICFCFKEGEEEQTDMTCGGYHKGNALEALGRVASQLNPNNPKARAYLTSGTMNSQFSDKSDAPPSDRRLKQIKKTEAFWEHIVVEFNEKHKGKYLIIPIRRGSTDNVDVDTLDQSGVRWIFGFKIRHAKNL